jgi:predicted metal-binding protein
MTTWITVCDTCKREGWAETGAPETDGARLAALIEAKAAGDPGLRVRRTSCLMGCTHGCNVAVQAAGKLCYTLGRFAPEAGAAAAIVDWARLHAASLTGQVPYRQWPEGVKGHFVTRHPPLPLDDAAS